ncbi:unnamed protein product [Discosporangium mesarthrocarpum]
MASEDELRYEELDVEEDGYRHLHPSVSDIIDAIGMGPFQTRVVFICGMGTAIDSMEVLVVAFILNDVAATFDLSAVGKGLLGSSSFLGDCKQPSLLLVKMCYSIVHPE